MIYLCNRDCQAVINDKITFVAKDQVVTADKNPKPGTDCFTQIGKDEGDKVDFAVAGEAELLSAKWTMSEAKEAVKDLYGIDLVKKSGETKGDMVAKILDARYRQVD